MVSTRKILISVICTWWMGSVSYGRESIPSEQEFIGSQQGLPCASLVDLSSAEVAALTHSANKEDFDNFCVPEDVYDCSDYNDLLYQLGTLERHNQVHCRFVPN